ncbi:PLP-dependent cysteine synthase family protein [Glycomyces harbinensis]|uniref:L-cysteine desulfhydrase Cds1 n=1 Tax=Glycomyces harbinensis TaxID=58114 RepID=A0A1G6UVN4_9ACTN|nr:PLP-dependent cysteine synthase family protein [Glycomyces harbinensis]SDD45304.1 cysteine synthase A [Glycomyces harbinensis]
MESIDRTRSRLWTNWAITTVEADANRSADTHLLPFPLPPEWGVDLYLKDESTHPTGSLKHRLARSLFLYAICNGWVDEGTPIIEASSGSTAVSEAYFARMLGLPFTAVMPESTSRSKIEQIEFYGGRAHLVRDATRVCAEAERLAAETGGHFMDQFTYAERATDWRGNNNIAESVFDQMRLERHPVPAWVVVGAGTGGTSATIGRYVRYRKYATSLCVVDPERSAFFAGWRDGDPEATASGSRIEGIGRPKVEPSFVPALVDRMVKVDDAESIACLRWASERLGRRLGGSTGTNLVAALAIIAEMRGSGQGGSIVTLLCDSGMRYGATYFDDAWVAAQGIDLAAAAEKLAPLLPA